MADPLSRPDAAIEVDMLTRLFGSVQAVNNLSFRVPYGSTTALLGGNGAGKTTTLSMLLGLLLPTFGSIRLLGQDMLRHRYRVLPRINFSSPYVDLPQRLTVQENLTVYGHLYEVAHLKQRIEQVAEDLNLTELLRRPCGKLSAGQKSRVALAKSLLNQPEILLLDEPTASMDPDSADWLRGYMQNYQRQHGATILLASHNMGEVERLCDQVLMLKQGRLVDQGAPADLLRRYGRPSLEEVFLDIARNRRDGQPEAKA